MMSKTTDPQDLILKRESKWLRQ